MLIKAVVRDMVKAVSRRPPERGGGGIVSAVSSGAPGQGALTYMQAYGGVGWLFAVVSRISEAVASANWQLYRTKPDGSREEMKAHPALDLWRDVNPFYTRQEFVETFQQHMELVGEAWWLLVRDQRGRVAEMWPLRPDRMTPVAHPTEWLLGYVYRVGAEMIPLGLDDVIFLRRPNPIDPYRGIGAVQSILADLDSEKYAAQWNRNFFLNSAEPGGIIQVDHPLTDTEFEEMLLRWRVQHQGVSNAHRVAILEHGTWVDRRYTMRDMQFQELRKVNRDAILGAFGMPLHLLGISETVNRAVAEASEMMFTRWIVKPRLERIAQSLNERLLPLLGVEGYEFVFDNPVPDDRVLNLDMAAKGYQLGVLTQNEARGLMGFGSVDGGEGFNPYMGLSVSATGVKSIEAGQSSVSRLLIAKVSNGQTAEERMAGMWQEWLATEAEGVIEALGPFFPVKAEMSSGFDYSWDWWARYGEAFVAMLMEIAFEHMSGEGLPMLQAQRLAVQYAQERGALLLRVDGDLNLARMTQARVREIVAEGISGGQSLGTVAKRLREDYAFSPKRAMTIARTETGTAWGWSSLEAGKAQGRDQKSWNTQSDVLVCGACLENEAAGWIPIGDAFSSGHQYTTAHVNCRCRTGTRTSFEEAAFRGEPKAMAAVRCPKCQRLLGRDVIAGQFRCPRCKWDFGVKEGAYV